MVEDSKGTVRDLLDESVGPENGLRDGLSAMRIMSRPRHGRLVQEFGNRKG